MLLTHKQTQKGIQFRNTQLGKTKPCHIFGSHELPIVLFDYATLFPDYPRTEEKAFIYCKTMDNMNMFSHINFI